MVRDAINAFLTGDVDMARSVLERDELGRQYEPGNL